jgi:dolichol-phosphate mannosyltransferase
MLAAIGILGIYIGKIFNESKGRPIYIVESKTDD